ncbi:cation:proton antiporter [Telmatospirillum siberiense]|uniref:Pesticidal protein Cry5Ba n=1 Tax=Telmatospirillum siberiense TaxID=382514 RepID=A0A2N3PZ16_9PROT|nr:sodium:proton antiporter [Telmatospirillum siberiense]PKU25625.1 pesticidal protein Cry5Ba [Telmatospirillum siberiense]
MGSTEAAKEILLNVGIILAVGTFFAVVAQRIKLPDVAIYLLVGIALGPGMLGWVNIPAASTTNQIILIFGASYLLFDGGASLRFAVLKEVWITIVILAVPGVVVTALITAAAAHYLLGLPMIVALLLGNAIASTDPATLVPVFKQVHVKDRIAQTVISESAFNDATGAVMTFGVLAVAMGSGEVSLGHSVLDFIRQTAIGLGAGVIIGYAAAFLVAHSKYGHFAEFAPAVSILAAIATYLLADRMDGSGFMAVFVLGMIVGNRRSFGFAMPGRHEDSFDSWIGNQTAMLRMFVFILLGSQVDFAVMNRNLAGGVAVVAVFMLVARPVTVFLCATPDRRAKWSLKELLFMCWVRETGVIPAALAGMLVGMKAPGADVIASVTFIAVLMTILIQATTTKWLARKFDLLVE